MRQAGIKDSVVRRVKIVYVYDLFPDDELTKTFNSQKQYYDWTMSAEAQRVHVKLLTMVLDPKCEFKTLF